MIPKKVTGNEGAMWSEMEDLKGVDREISFVLLDPSQECPPSRVPQVKLFEPRTDYHLSFGLVVSGELLGRVSTRGKFTKPSAVFVSWRAKRSISIQSCIR